MAIQFATSDTNVLSSVIIGYYVIGLGIGFAWYCTSRFRPGVRVLFAALTILTVIGGINAGTYAVSANTHSVAHVDHGSSYDVANAFGLNPEQAYPFVLEGAVAPKPAEPYFELPSLTPDKSGNLTIVFVNNGSTQLTIPARHVKLGNSDAWDNKRSMLGLTLADWPDNDVTIYRRYSPCHATVLDLVLICRQRTASKVVTLSPNAWNAGLRGIVESYLYRVTLYLTPTAQQAVPQTLQDVSIKK
jgi:hypothetical protein